MVDIHNTVPVCVRRLGRSALLLIASLVLVTGCGVLGGSTVDGTFNVGGIEYGLSISDGEWVTQNRETVAPSGRVFWYIDVKVTNNSKGNALFFAPGLALTVPGSETDVTPAQVDENAILKTRIPASCALNGVKAELSQKTVTTYITTENYKGIPYDLCVFPMKADGIRGDKDDSVPLAPGDSRVVVYTSTSSFIKGDFPDLKYYVANSNVLLKAIPPYQALED